MSSDSDNAPSSSKRQAAERIVQRLHAAGHVAYFAGGCVRDHIMGREPTDYDVATDAPPQRVLELFRRSRKVGQAFGVVMVCAEGAWVEVATFRTEWGYSDHRHPDHVQFSDAQHDALRRDFTINGLFYDPASDQVIDYVGGQEDIRHRVVRAIGDPRQRFGEDYLRMLRAVRFAAKLSFTIDPATAQAIREHAAELRGISRERIGQEVRMMFEHPSRGRAARLMEGLRLDGPALQEPHVDREPLALEGLEQEADFASALAAWAIDRHIEPHRPSNVRELMIALSRLKAVAVTQKWREALVLSNEETQAMADALRTLPAAIDWPSLTIAQRKRLLARLDWPRIRRLLNAAQRLLPEGSLSLAKLDAEARALAGDGVAPSPLITGDDLIAAGFEPGPRFRGVLDRVYDAQLEGAVTTRQGAVELAKSMME